MVGNFCGYKFSETGQNLGFRKFFTVLIFDPGRQILHICYTMWYPAQWLKLSDLNSSFCGETIVWHSQTKYDCLCSWPNALVQLCSSASLFCVPLWFPLRLSNSHQRHARLQAFTWWLEVVLDWNMTCFPWMINLQIYLAQTVFDLW